ncbi:type I-E CRISPR-associated endoribonuclease Cas2e [Chelativorans sp.]|uniref:type I-E CRISPR-associated endoribonuclease Cas2e n=1 Tax=Chelativorans sp. TaxID=2203393 RepID=UPI002811E1B6|nr:type I-E CRISPR-associated endoribonuclease Cas2e [Chelativorans sp.]
MMPMVMVITCHVKPRYRGFLGSAMLELARGVYAHPRMSPRAGTQIWEVLSDWYGQLYRGSIVMTLGRQHRP